MLPPDVVLDPLLRGWLQEDIGRGDRTTMGLGAIANQVHKAIWIAKAPGITAGLPNADRVFTLLDPHTNWVSLGQVGSGCEAGAEIAQVQGPLSSLLMGERVALNLAMRLSGIATLPRQYVDKIADLPAFIAL